MKHTNYHKVIRIVGVIILLGGIFVAGAYTGTKKSVAQFFSPKQSELAEIPRTNVENTDISQFWYIWNLMNEKYMLKDENTPTTTEKVYGAISGLVSAYGDPYTEFFPPQEAKLFNDQVSGSFGGVGIEIGMRDNFITVIAPLKDSPAAQAGILAGDIILEVDKKKTDGLGIDKVISMIRGDKGTQVELGVARKGTPGIQYIKVTRDTVKVPVLKTSTKGDVFMIELYSFTRNSPQLFTEALQEFVASGNKKLIIDLRNNPGGYLEAAVDIASYFLPEGTTIVKEYSGPNHPELIHQSKGYNLLETIPETVILINEGSASASEILAGALSEQKAAHLIGTKSFGKGSVQEFIDLPDKSAVKITIAKWLTPNGVSISDKGITPEKIIDEKPVLDKKTEKYNDPQLEAALKLLE